MRGTRMAGATPVRSVGAPPGPPIAFGPRGRSKGSKETAEVGAAIGELGGEVCPLEEDARAARRVGYALADGDARRAAETPGRGVFGSGTTPGRGNLTWGCFRDP